MLFIGIVVVLLLYVGLYLVWDAANVSLDGAEPILRSLADAFLRPGNEIFFLLRSLLLLSLAYVIADFVVSGARRALKRRRAEPETIQATFRETNDHAYREL